MRPLNSNREVSSCQILDMTARLAFSTASSRSFDLERHSASLCPTRQLGWAEVHHPCADHIKARIRVCLPEEYLQPEKMQAIVDRLLEHTGIAPDETYEAEFFAPANAMKIEQPVDRNEYTDRLY